MSARIVDEHAHGFGWVHDDPLQRACQALAADGRVWLVDPTDEPEAMAKAEALGEIAGVIQLLDRHPRDNAAIAARYGAPVHVVPHGLPGTPFKVLPVLRTPFWKEVALWWPAASLLVVSEVVGSAPHYAVGPGAVGVHPMLRTWPPGRALASRRPEHLHFGHGAGVQDGAADALRTAFERSRRDIPHLLRALPHLARSGRQVVAG